MGLFGKKSGPSAADLDYLAYVDKVNAEKLASQGKNPDGSPMDLKFNQLVNMNTGRLAPQFQLQAQPDVAVDRAAQDAIRSRAMTEGDSPWAKMMLEKQALEQATSRDNMVQSGASQSAQARNQMAMRGGVTGGASERLAKSNLRSQMMEQNKLARQGSMDQMGIRIQDDQTKQGLLKDTVGYDFQNADLGLKNRQYSTDVNKTNITAALADIEAKRGFDMEQYKSKMSAWGAGKTADAQRAASKGGKK